MADGFVEFTPENITTPDGINQLNRIIRTVYDNIVGDTEGVRIFSGQGSPEGVISAGVGSMYLRTDGGANSSVYRKESGTGNTGWVASTNLTIPISTANGGTGLDLSGTLQGNIVYFSATGVLSTLSPGAAGLFLKSNGTGANPSYGASSVAEYSVTGTLHELSSVATEVTDTSPSHKTTPFGRSGVVRASIDAEAFNGLATGSVQFRINGILAGSAHVTGAYATYTDDLTVAVGDVIDVEISGVSNFRAKNFKISASNPVPEVAVTA